MSLNEYTIALLYIFVFGAGQAGCYYAGMESFHDTAMRAVKAAEEVTRRYFCAPVDVMLKSDGTPVSEADKKAEKAIIDTIRREYPDHAFWGEETGIDRSDGEYLWVIDPIDGTKNFIGGIPLWGTLLALVYKGEPILGMSHMPAMNELLVAEKGKGAFLNGQPVKVSRKSRLSESMISFGSLGSFRDKNLDRGIIPLIYACGRQRSFGDLWPYHLLATGKVDIVIEASIRFYDVAPFVVIISEAGGRTSEIGGAGVSFDTKSFVGTNGVLHEAVLDYFRSEAEHE